MRRAIALCTLALAVVSSATARTWNILPYGTGDAPTIQAGMDSAAVGDTVSLACAEYKENRIAVRSGVVLRGEEEGCPAILRHPIVDPIPGPLLILSGGGPTTTIENIACRRSPDLSPEKCEILIEGETAVLTNLTFLTPWSPRADLRVIGSQVLFEDSMITEGYPGISCEEGSSVTVSRSRFEYCSPAIHARDVDVIEVLDTYFYRCSGLEDGTLYVFNGSSLRVERCWFRSSYLAGTGGGVFAAFVPEVNVLLSLFENNHATVGGAIYSFGSNLTIDQSTFHGNHGPHGAILYAIDSDVLVSRSILEDSRLGQTVVCSDSNVELSCSDVYGNDLGDWVGCLSGMDGLNDNFSADPQFCYEEPDRFMLRSDSPCAPPGVTGCGLVGAFPVGCGPVSVEATSWAKVKARYR